MMTSLVAKGFEIGTKSFVSLQVGEFKVGKIGQNDRQFSTLALCTSHVSGLAADRF